MTTVPVVWWTANPESIARGYWDQGILERLLDRTLWRPPNPVTYRHAEVEDIAPLWFSSWAFDPDARGFGEALLSDGAVVVVPGAHNANDDALARLVSLLESLGWWLLIITGDEERSFPLDRMPIAKRSAIWTTSARPDVGDVDVVLGFGIQPAVLEHLHRQQEQPTIAWESSFVGQDTHDRRHELVEVMASLPIADTLIVRNDEFGGTAGPKGEGLTPASYAEVLARTMVAPAPSGPLIPDSFRLWEALEAGAVPVADTVTVAHGAEPTYWNLACDGEPPFPTIASWDQLPAIIQETRRTWPAPANRAGSWWAMRKRDLALRLDSTVRRLSGTKVPPSAPDCITVVVTTSPTPAHPSTDDVEVVLASIRDRLPDAEVIIAADGVRGEQRRRVGAYEEYLRRLLWLTQRMDNVVVLRRETFGHQALTTRVALAHVVTPLVLFMEHDTPLQGPNLPWDALSDALHGGAVDLVRFHHESHVLEPHEHLMVGPVEDVEGVLLRPTAQWSQRPHLTRTLWYRELLARYFGSESRTMIEDTMHGVVDYHWRTFGPDGWEQFRLWLFHEPDEQGSIQRSGHLDSRGDDEKYPMVYAYDGPKPPGAPNPTRRLKP